MAILIDVTRKMVYRVFSIKLIRSIFVVRIKSWSQYPVYVYVRILEFGRGGCFMDTYFSMQRLGMLMVGKLTFWF